MSYLIRTGNNRNNISWSTTENSTTRYLRRTSSGRNNVVWTTIPNGSTYNILQRNGTGKNNVLWANLQIENADTLNFLNNLFKKNYNWHWEDNYNFTSVVNESSRTITFGGPHEWKYQTDNWPFFGPMRNKKSDDGYRSSTDDYISMGSNTYETYFKDKTFTAKRVSYPSSTVSDYRNMSNVQLKLEPYFHYESATDLSTYVLKFYWPSRDNWLNFSLSINFSPSLDPPTVYY